MQPRRPDSSWTRAVLVAAAASTALLLLSGSALPRPDRPPPDVHIAVLGPR